MYRIQPTSYTDQIRDGQELTKLPYPIFAHADGRIINYFDEILVVGFQRDLAVQKIDLWWINIVADPSQAVGMYLVTANDTGGWSTHETAIMSIEEVTDAT